jgi:hypothetical protein
MDEYDEGTCFIYATTFMQELQKAIDSKIQLPLSIEEQFITEIK